MRSTFSRAFIPATVILLCALILVGASFRALVQDYLVEESLQDLLNDAEVISQLAGAYYNDEGMSNEEFLLNLSVASRVSDADAVFWDAEGSLILCSSAPFGCVHQGWHINPEYLDRVLEEGKASDTGVKVKLYEERRYVVSVPMYDARKTTFLGIVMVSIPMAETDLLLQRLTDIYLTVAIAVVLASTVVMTIIARRQSRPLQQVARAATAFGHGDLTARVHLDRSYPLEIEELALAFNNMASAIQKSDYQRQEFVANVSHELKTPMTTIGGYIDGILDGTIPPDRSRHYMQIVSDETKRLSRLVRSMLDISRLQGEAIPAEKKTRFDIEECAGQVLITFEQKIMAKKLDVNVEIPDFPLYTFACQDHITQVIYNLLDNAVKFCPQGGELGLSIRQAGSKIYVTVSNQGDTIPPEELPLVFDRFHKLDKARTNRDGWGLGLYIVKTIVCSHGEDISVSSKNGRTEFTFTLPQVN